MKKKYFSYENCYLKNFDAIYRNGSLTMFNPIPHSSHKNLIYKEHAEWVKLDLDVARSKHMCYDLLDKRDISSSFPCNSLCRSVLLKLPLMSFCGLVLLNIDAVLELAIFEL